MRALWALGLVLLALPLGLPAAGVPIGHGAAAPAVLPFRIPTLRAANAMPAAAEGDLVVTAANSPYILQGGASNGGVSLIEGNITVEAGGVLELRTIVLIQEEFVGDEGTTAQRLDHLYTISDEGTIEMNDSILASYVSALNPYPKIDLNISNGGSLTLNESSLEFAGWVSVYGAGSRLTLQNHSAIEANPLAAGLVTNTSISNDTRYAPVLSAGGGAQVGFFDSRFNGTYADNVTAHGYPSPAVPIVDPTNHDLTNGAGATWNDFTLRSGDSENLTRAVLYRTITAATIAISYTSTVAANSDDATINFDGALPFGPVAFGAGGGTVAMNLPQDVVSGINNGSFPTFLSELDANGATVALGPLDAATSITVTGIALNVTPDWNYNLTFTGTGTTLTAVDSSFDINFNLTPGSPVANDVFPPTPWGSQKIILQDGATGYFANVSTTAAPERATFNSSAIQTEGTSSANFYRWLDLGVTNGVGAPVEGANVAAFFALNNIQSDNTTASDLNALTTADPALGSYVAWQDGVRGAAAYGASNASGIARLLLASTVLTFSTLPDGDYLGVYHVAISIPGAASNGTRWVTASVSPYPTNMTPAAPDTLAGPVIFPNFEAALGVVGTSLLVNNVTISNGTVAIGQNLTVQITVESDGNAAAATSAANLVYIEAAPALPLTLVAPLNVSTPLAVGARYTFNLTWEVTEKIVGLHGTIHATLQSVIAWNPGDPSIGGSVIDTVPITIVPSYLALTYTPPTVAITAAGEFESTGVVHFSGLHNATINVTAIGSNGFTYLIGQQLVRPGPFEVFLQAYTNMSTGTYSLNVSAYYNNRTVYVDLPASLKVQGPSTAATPSFLDQTILGLPLWLWIVIAVAIVGAVVGLLWFLRRRSKGKLVECGECGELIPESATTCPKCGAEFETDLVRCSRCSSTIPANSAQCPECAAQLLGAETPDPVRQGFLDFVEKFRTEARKELSENYSEGAFWEWWKRQASYVSYEQWKLQQSQSGRSGMGAPPTSATSTPEEPSAPAPKAGSDMSQAPKGTGPTPSATAGSSQGSAPARMPEATAPAGAAGPAMKPCGSCGKEIPPDYLVCPFCGAVTR